ncbi:phosphatase 2C-like domain-containing protein [Zopfochytrium polystomum]|nr:phosphatase 2C-like domain-containing protein [Zopfochytrium polystomum]
MDHNPESVPLGRTLYESPTPSLSMLDKPGSFSLRSSQSGSGSAYSANVDKASSSATQLRSTQALAKSLGTTPTNKSTLPTSRSAPEGKPIFTVDSSADDDDDDDDEEDEISPEEAEAERLEKLRLEAELKIQQRKAGFVVGFAEDRNRRFRRTMEDSHTYLYNFGGVDGQGFFAIYDGHAGKGAAEWCGNHLHENFHRLLQADPSKPIPELLHQSFLITDQQLGERKLFSGCTAVVAFFRIEDRDDITEDGADEGTSSEPKKRTRGKRRVLYTANVGDARAVLSRKGQAVRLSYDHKGTDAQEVQRITESGGFVVNNRVNGVLAVTRSLGDVNMKEWIIGSPYTTETVLMDSDDLLVLACDGIWDVCSDQDAIDLLNTIDVPQVASERLMAHALQKCSTDNLSVLVVKLDPLPQ